jgi:hypothetical protein
LRSAIDEKFIPLSVRNLKIVANIVYSLTLILGIVYFVLEEIVFKDIQKYIEIIVNSEIRINNIVNINLNLNDISLINQGYLDPNGFNLSKESMIMALIENFKNATTELKNS